MTEAAQENKQKRLLKVFKAALETRLDEVDAALKMHKFIMKMQEMDHDDVTPAQEKKFEKKFEALGAAYEEANQAGETARGKAKAKALSKGLTEEDVTLAFDIAGGYKAEQYKEVFGKKTLPKDLVKRMKEQDRKIVSFGEKPEYAKFYAK